MPKKKSATQTESPEVIRELEALGFQEVDSYWEGTPMVPCLGETVTIHIEKKDGIIYDYQTRSLHHVLDSKRNLLPEITKAALECVAKWAEELAQIEEEEVEEDDENIATIDGEAITLGSIILFNTGPVSGDVPPYFHIEIWTEWDEEHPVEVRLNWLKGRWKIIDVEKP